MATLQIKSSRINRYIRLRRSWKSGLWLQSGGMNYDQTSKVEKLKKLKHDNSQVRHDSIELCSILQWGFSVNSAVPFTWTVWNDPESCIRAGIFSRVKTSEGFREITPAVRSEKILAVSAPRRVHTAYHSGKKLRSTLEKVAPWSLASGFFAVSISTLSEYLALDLQNRKSEKSASLNVWTKRISTLQRS